MHSAATRLSLRSRASLRPSTRSACARAGSPFVRSWTRPRFATATEMLQVSRTWRASARPSSSSAVARSSSPRVSSARPSRRSELAIRRLSPSPRRSARPRSKSRIASVVVVVRGGDLRERAERARGRELVAHLGRQLGALPGELGGLLVLPRGHREPGELGERRRLGAAVADLLRELEAALERLLGGHEVALAERRVAGGEVGLRERAGRDALARGERLAEPAAALAHQPARAPEAHERAGELQSELDLAGRDRPRERGADVVVLLVEAIEPERLVGARELGLGRQHQLEVALGVPPAQRPRARPAPRALERVLPDRLEQPEARLAVGAVRLPDEALVDERGEALEHLAEVHLVAADGVGDLERAAAREDAEPREQGLLGRLEQVVAPVDRVAERALPRRQVVGAAGEQVEPLLEPAEDRLRREQLHARGRELDREREPVEAAADPGHRGRVLVRELEARLDRLRPVDEELDGRRARERAVAVAVRLGQRERRHRELALLAQAQRGLARHERGQARCGGEQLVRRASPRAAPARSCRARAGPGRRRAAARSPRRAAGRRSPRRRGRSAIAEPTMPASLTGARSTKKARPSSAASSAAAASASRVLPVPPGPVSVTSRTSCRARELDQRRELLVAADQRGRLRREVDEDAPACEP